MKRHATEDQIQAAIVQWLAIQERQGRLRYFHVPNGGLRAKSTGARMKRLGVRPGVPDLCIVRNNGVVVWVEVKADGGKLSQGQHDWCGWLNDRPGHYVIVARSLGEFVEYFYPS